MLKYKESFIPEKIKTHQVIEILMTTLDARDNNTFEHSWRVAETVTLLAEELKFNKKEIEKIHIAAHLHDIGKIGVPDNILNKSGRLTSKEMLEIQRHPVIGYDILKKTPIFDSIAPIVLYHHERFDGQGYPAGLEGKGIPLAARIIAVADAFDAITSSRSYRTAQDCDFAYKEINAHSGEQFDSNVVEIFNQKFNSIIKKTEKINNNFKKEFVPWKQRKEDIEHQKLPHSCKVCNL